MPASALPLQAPRIRIAVGGMGAAAAVALAAFAALLVLPGLFNCGDTSWHLAAGEWMLRHRAVPRHDVFSYTVLGRRWIAHEWLAEVAMAAAFAVGGWTALALLFAACFAGVILIQGRWLARFLPTRGVLLAATLTAAVLAPAALARPHLLAWGLLAAWLAALLRAREHGRAPPPSLALLMLGWANAHASFLYGLGLLAAFAIEALLDGARARERRGWALLLALSLLAALCTPNGIDGLLFPITTSAMPSLTRMVMEWQPTDLGHDRAFTLLVLCGLYVGTTARPRLSAVRAVILLGTLEMALAHGRHQAIVAIVAPMLLAPALGRPRQAPEGEQPLLLALGGTALLLAAFRVAHPAAEQDGATDPVAALDAVLPRLGHQRVLNGYAFGGPLIRRGVPVFVDGRTDLYGDAFMDDYGRIEGGDRAALNDAVRRNGIRWTILPPATPLAHMLAHAPGWRRVYADRWAVVDVADR